MYDTEWYRDKTPVTRLSKLPTPETGRQVKPEALYALYGSPTIAVT